MMTPKQIGEELSDLMDGYYRFKASAASLQEDMKCQEAKLTQMQKTMEFYQAQMNLMETILGILPGRERNLVLFRMRHPAKKPVQVCNELNLGKKEYTDMWKHAIRLLAQALAQERGVSL